MILNKQINLLIFLTLSLLILSGCDPKPQPIQLGSEECAYCKMMITDGQFASQIVNNQSKAYKFDSVECMAAYDLTENSDNFHSKWVPDFHNSEEWLKAEDAVYLHSETLRSPMGLYLSAYKDRESALQMQNEYGGDIVDYNKVKEIVRKEWIHSGQNTHNHQ